jgi:hypothetical protein
MAVTCSTVQSLCEAGTLSADQKFPAFVKPEGWQEPTQPSLHRHTTYV